MFGYGGMRIKPYSLEFSSTFMPKDVEKLTFVGLNYLGTKFDLSLDSDVVEIQINRVGKMSIELTFQDGSSDPFTGTYSLSSPLKKFLVSRIVTIIFAQLTYPCAKIKVIGRR